MAGIFSDGDHHCAVFHADEQGASRRAFLRCKLNPGHKQFMKIDAFRTKDPAEVKMKEEDMPQVWNIIDRTVRIVLTHTSADRPDTYPNSENPYPCNTLRGNSRWARSGTGFLVGTQVVNGPEDPCPCPVCTKCTEQTPPIKDRYYFGISTATHVVFDTKEARNAVIELFYDSEDRQSVEVLYGFKVNSDSLDKVIMDRCYMTCLTHDHRLAKRLREMTDERLDGFPCELLVSHPHGVSKRISVGKFIHQKFVVLDTVRIKLKTGMNVRITDCADVSSTVESINHCFIDHGPVIGFKEDSNTTLVFLCDLSVIYPNNVLIEYCMDGAFAPNNLLGKLWWRLPTGAELVTDDGHRYKIPKNDDGNPGHTIEISAKETLFHYDLKNIFGSETRLYSASTYDIASCPGSSGAPVFFRNGPTSPESCIRDGVHFGCLGDRNTSGLDDNWIFHLLHA